MNKAFLGILCVAALALAGSAIFVISLAASRTAGCSDPLRANGKWCQVGPAWLYKINEAAAAQSCVMSVSNAVCCTIDDRRCCVVTNRNKPEVACDANP